MESWLITQDSTTYRELKANLRADFVGTIISHMQVYENYSQNSLRERTIEVSSSTWPDIRSRAKQILYPKYNAHRGVRVEDTFFSPKVIDSKLTFKMAFTYLQSAISLFLVDELRKMALIAECLLKKTFATIVFVASIFPLAVLPILE